MYKIQKIMIKIIKLVKNQKILTIRDNQILEYYI